ncbi:SusC/RagA family TonB-linked outer membrane protein [Pedobacter nyackensis]|uniref:TonB-linked outer membrane protein, SusC/RagA family n=1 Tax=Pedobacter nyackensis TaxID=475255 RepID=A0A1W2EU49_9SPHI|nr:TonB-dependent receptor [Pedobacter nyackensis]SMD13219.1 TonB-linked outer membrane protein, SusC/RagA family [Pedobacter nyackensis]
MRKIYLFVVCMICVFSAFAQQTRRVEGKVTNQSDGTPLVGASVLVKGSKVGVTTNSDGKYLINVPSQGNSTLAFSYTGYLTKEMVVGDNSIINLSLAEDSKSLNDIVVIGYGTVKRKDLTGSVGQVNMNDLSKAPVRSFDEALAGRVAGVQVTSSDGQPGSGIDIVIRGNNSISQANSPLYVIDGFPIEDMNNNAINPQDIESIDILKDASATAIYGARGANGVIVITTKKGKTGPPVFSFGSSFSTQQDIKRYKLLDPYEFVKLQLEWDPTLVSSTTFPSPTETYLTGPGKTLDDYKTVKSIDWQDKVLRTALMQNHNLSVNGGTEKTKYALSGSLIDQDGVMIASNYTRYQGRLVLDHQLTKKIKIGINTNYSYLQQTGSSPAQTIYSATLNTMYSVWGYKPVEAGGVDPDLDALFDDDVNPANDYRANPILNLKNTYNVNIGRSLIANAYLEYELMPDLKLRASGGIVNNEGEKRLFSNSNTSSGRGSNGPNGRIDYSKSFNWLSENTLTWNKQFNKKHNLNLLGGFTLQKGTGKSYGRGANKIPEGMGLMDGLDQGIGYRIDTFQSLWTMGSFLSRVNYNYDSRYLLTVSIRADGSSKFPAENHWGYFPSGALAWNFKNEHFLKNSNLLSEGKLRFSYGQTGNNRVGDFDYLTKYYNPVGSAYAFNNQYVDPVVAINLGNDKLKWETTEQADLGLDLGFFNQRINLTTEVYRKKTKDLLLRADLPTSSGFATAYKNIGSVENEGLEFTLNTVNIKTRHFNWNTSFNISFNRGKVLGLSDNQTELTSYISWDSPFNTIPGYIAKLGGPLGEMYGLISEGTYKLSEFDQPTPGKYVLKPGTVTNGNSAPLIQPGDIKYRDVNGDGKVTASDYTVIGHGLPKHTGGFTNNFSYKGFDLNVFFQWSYGNDIMNANRIKFEAGGGNYLNQFASYKDRWTFSNPDSDLPRVKGTQGATSGYTSRNVEDGSYLRLKTVSFGYTFENELIRRLKLKSLRFYASAQNLVTWTKYSGTDPEVNTKRSALTSGFDYSAYPRARVITAGLNVSF